MATGKDKAVLRQLRTLFSVGAVRELSDGQLLERFATSRGEAAEMAFAELVERHGPMVLRVCRSLLVNLHDTQDAFQATFLVLVKKARSLWVRDSLGPWLHQVAYRTSKCVRASAARRRRHEARCAPPLDEYVTRDADDLGSALHEEIERLPERFRAPLVLCDLEGCTHEQAARHLGWPVGTVKSRQSRGRQRLRERLTRRGLAPSAGLLAAPLGLVHDGPSVLLDHELVRSTIGAAVQFGKVRYFAKGTAGSFAQEVIRSMTRTRWLKMASLLVAVGAMGSGASVLAQRGKPAPEPRNEPPVAPPALEELPVYTVKPGTFKVSVVERGLLAALRANDLYNNVEGQRVIIGIKPEGSAVKKGEIVCELDSAGLQDSLLKQRISTNQAEAALQNARLTREVAEISVVEYVQGILPQDLNTLKLEIELAQKDMQIAESRAERARRARRELDQAAAPKAGARTPSDIAAELEIDDRIEVAQQTAEREKRLLERSIAKREILENYTKPKTIKELKSEVEKAHSDELAKRATWELEKSKEQKLEKLIGDCQIHARSDGMLVYAKDLFGPIGPSRIEVGVTVRERQKIGSIVDLDGPMQVHVPVRESKIGLIVLSMRARIKVDALPDRTLSGTVVEVSPLPMPRNFFAPEENLYRTSIRIGERLRSLRPGMTAEVEMFSDERANVFFVPTEAVVAFEGKHHVAVKRGAGVFEWRTVTPGASNGEFVEIKEGLQSDERVLLQPTGLLSEEQKRNLTRDRAATSPKSASQR
jgi:HlyD family secretion protein